MQPNYKVYMYSILMRSGRQGGCSEIIVE